MGVLPRGKARFYKVQFQHRYHDDADTKLQKLIANLEGNNGYNSGEETPRRCKKGPKVQVGRMRTSKLYRGSSFQVMVMRKGKQNCKFDSGISVHRSCYDKI